MTSYMPMKNKRFTRQLICIIIAFSVCIVAVILFFAGFVGKYQASIREESGDHLIEINNLASSYIRDTINNNWQVVEDIAYRLDASTPNYDDGELFEYLSNKIDRWSIDGLRLYTSDGRGYDQDANPIDRDTAAEYIVLAREKGSFWQVRESRVLFTMAVENGATYRGSQMVAVSIEYDIGKFIRNAQVNTFDDRAHVYLVQRDGIIVAQHEKEYTDTPYNLSVALAGNALRRLDGSAMTLAELLSGEDETACMFTDESGDSYYLVSAQVNVVENQWRVVYIVPMGAVNASMAVFSNYVVLTSVMMIVVFFALCVIAFTSVYRLQKRLMDKELTTRERLFDLLTSNGHEVFSLYSLRQSEPVYQSENCKAVLGEDAVLFYGGVGAVTLKNRAGEQSPFLKALGDSYSRWDGVGDYITENIPAEVNGERRQISAHIYSVPNDPELYMSVTRDVTKEAERAEALRSALALANSANQAKTAFLANMSHDIRTPMNAIINMTAFARQSIGDPEKQAEYLETVQRSSEHLLRLINDVLEVSRIESGKMEVANQPFCVNTCVSEIIAIIKPLAKKKRQQLTIGTKIDHSCVLGDRLKLNQILLNLLNNAVKYTPDGGEICFTAQELSSINEKLRAYRFSVKDTGVGISQTDIESIFKPFSRVQGEKTDGIEGTGLGLSITRGFVTAMGGKISVTSEQDSGSEFVVELSFEADTAMEAPQTQVKPCRVDFSGKRAFLCEDNRVNRLVAGNILTSLGFELEYAVDGTEGIEKYLASPPGYYDIIFMDIQMPGRDGYEATMEIRNSDHPDAASIPIVAMTANAFAEDVEKARSAGMNGHIAKPIDIDYLVSVASALLDGDGNQQ